MHETVVTVESSPSGVECPPFRDFGPEK